MVHPAPSSVGSGSPSKADEDAAVEAAEKAAAADPAKENEADEEAAVEAAETAIDPAAVDLDPATEKADEETAVEAANLIKKFERGGKRKGTRARAPLLASPFCLSCAASSRRVRGQGKGSCAASICASTGLASTVRTALSVSFLPFLFSIFSFLFSLFNIT